MYYTALNSIICIIFIVSAHGTFIGSIRLDARKPQQVPLDSDLHFGASTRRYVIRERPQTIGSGAALGEGDKEDMEGGLLGLPETETELDVRNHLLEIIMG